MAFIATPTAGQLVAGPAQGNGLFCAGRWFEVIETENSHGATHTIEVPYRNAPLSVTLKQANTPDQTGNTRTDHNGDWKITFSSCKPGHADVSLLDQAEVLESVAFNIAPNLRVPLALKLEGLDASGNQLIDLPEGGRHLQIEVLPRSPTRAIGVQLRAQGDLLPRQTGSPGTPLAALAFSSFLPGKYAPMGPAILVDDTDFFGVTTTTQFNFQTRDFTDPAIAITEPAEDQVIVVGQLPLTLAVRGTVSDPQSGYKDGTLTYSFAGQTDVPVNVAGGAWVFELSVASYGQYELTMTAADGVGNTRARIAVRQFEVVSSYLPKSIDELLSPSAYLNELLRFARSHLLTGDTPNAGAASAVDLTREFRQPFGELAQPGSVAAGRPVSDLLTPVQILRDVKSADTASLIGRWTFSELAQQAPDGVRDRAGRFDLNGGYHGSGRYADVVARMVGAPGTDMEGAMVLDGESYAQIAHRPVLEVGRDERDFTLSCWVYPNDTGNGTWRQILYKGHEPVWPTDVNRTFSLWLMPDSNTVYFRISTTGNVDDGGASASTLPVQRWSHLAYVKSGGQLKLYIDGKLDAEVTLAGSVVANTDPLIIGKSPYSNSYLGGFAELRLYGYALQPEDVEQLALNRRLGMTATPIADYHEAAYEALLLGLGTSLEELRGLGALSGAQRHALAERLGLLTPVASGDNLATIMPTYPPGSTMFEPWLAGAFGLPLTYTPEFPSELPIDFTGIVSAQRFNLSYRWSQEDARQAMPPELDPDLVEMADLAPAALDWSALLRARSTELTVQFDAFAALLGAGSAAAALDKVYSRDELSKLQALSIAEKAGIPIGAELAHFHLDHKMFRRLLAYIDQLTVALGPQERNDFAHLLTQLWKVRTRYTPWKQAETALGSRLWPTATTAAAWHPGSYKSGFLPWRGNALQRTAIERRLGGRLRAWQTIRDAQERSVGEVQRITLPSLRDDLLGIAALPFATQRMDQLTERWLVDFAATSATLVTPLEQATLSLQTLINGIRHAWYEASHVAGRWTIKPEYREQFDDEWQWLGNYGHWRAAVLSYLYPENLLFPELRKGRSAAFETFQTELRNMQPLSSGSLARPPAAFTLARNALGGDEAEYFAPMAIGLALQRAGLYASALDTYRQVFDASRAGAARKRAALLRSEHDHQAPAPFFDDRWTLELTDPHAVALRTDDNGQRIWGNPYTRHTITQIAHCLLAQADGEYAAGTKDARNKALSIYLEARQVLAFDELRDLKPVRPEQAYLPNPVVAAQRAHVDVALRKLRRGLSFSGTPLAPDLTRGPNAGAASSLTRPTPYRFKILMERARQLAAQAQQFESHYLSVMEKGEAEAEKLMRENFISEIAGQTVTLRQLGEDDARTGKVLAQLQQGRSQMQTDRYQSWLAAGTSEHERLQMKYIQESSTSRQVMNIADAVMSGTQAIQVAAGLIETVLSAGAKMALGVTIAAAAAGKAVAQGFLIDQETRSQLNGILASHERRAQEWQLQHDLSRQDVMIGTQQLVAADDRIAIAVQESLIARTQLTQSRQMLAFLNNKFTSVEFYQWLTGVLAETYAFFLRTAASTAQQAELQLAFERQETPVRQIKSDYWLSASEASGGADGSATPDRRGIGGSTRLLQDLYTLDQQAFSSERRLLNLSQSFSLSRLMPLEFEEFRRTGVLTISTPMQWFDEGFPGHYMRLLKRARISVAALIPPGQGIRATLTNGGLSRVVTAEPGFPTVVVRQDPQSVALTSPVAATGVFELDAQPDMLYPFEGTGVDTTWYFELPPAANPFAFDTLAEVVLTVDYSALMSYELRDRVIKKLPRRWSGDLTYSVRRDLPDVWYQLSNPSRAGVYEIDLHMDARSFPAGLSDLQIDEVALSMHLKDGSYPAAFVAPALTPSGGAAPTTGAAAALIHGLASSTQSGTPSWSVLRGAAGTGALWKFTLTTDQFSSFSLSESFQEANVDDIILVFTASGLRPAWLT
ncbi:hypothetical protein F2P44_08805 [Massilia sp. CCM 8695]|uniref:LamG-like jellyroll fold domain-containing protein n=1 Tax=Massilia frigida TaxID=2609281 RepID=A0ABX0N292_9BURK|nr:LamG domain-containing protein [Massilia frigida]NHZ79374.1 hypothetical protein [Massilia frigida]